MSRGISYIRKLLEGNEQYPPSEELWDQIVRSSKKLTPERQFRTIQDKMRRETNVYYKPSLPEPNLARFFYQGEYYFLDDANQIYKTDSGNALVGNHVGFIEQKNKSDINAGFDVTINGKIIHTILPRVTKEETIHNRHYYINSEMQVFEGFHPGHPYCFQIGNLNKEGKIELS
tara:strand:+ start:15125 stop:15646 length:522 start_codon:yes stop_codon:yes gene_type:complete